MASYNDDNFVQPKRRYQVMSKKNTYSDFLILISLYTEKTQLETPGYKLHNESTKHLLINGISLWASFYSY